MNAWVPENEEEEHRGRDERPSPGRRSRSAQRASTPPRRDAPASPGTAAPASTRGAQTALVTGQRGAAPEGAAPTRNAGGRGTNEQGTQPLSKIPQNPPLSAPVGGGKRLGIGRNYRSPVGDSKSIQCGQVVWVQQGKNAGQRGSRLPERRIPRWEKKWTSREAK